MKNPFKRTNDEQKNVRNPHIVDQNDAYSFRRSRTITGSTASSVRSVSEAHVQLRSPRLKGYGLRHHRRKLMVALVGVLVVTSGLVFIVSQYTSHITLVSSSSSAIIKSLNTTRYQSVMDDYYKDHPLERFRFVVNETRLAAYFTQKAPEVTAARVSKAPGGIWNGELTISPRTPVVAWTVKNQKYYVDETGSIFSTNYFAEPGVVVEDKSGVDPDIGIIASSKFLRFIGRVITLVNASGVATVSHVVIPVNTTREIDLQLAGRPYIVKAQLDRDPAGQATDIINAITYFTSKRITPQYIDVRVSSRAFYR